MHARVVCFVVVAIITAGCVDLDSAAEAIIGDSRGVAAGPPAPAVSGETNAESRLVNGNLTVNFLDVGQGDATLWQLPDGRIVIYDCGPAVDSAQDSPVVAALERLGHPRGSPIALLIASHGHLDHIGGCEEVLAHYDVEHVVDYGYQGDDAPRSYRRFVADVDASGARVTRLSQGATWPTPEAPLDLMPTPGGATIEVLWPEAPVETWDDIARASLVVRLGFGQATFCFQGDIEHAQERRLTQRLGAAAACDVYLVGHHGSRHASDATWLAALEPRLAVVSFGANSYGHPTSEALCRVQTAGANVLATHRQGDIAIASRDGASPLIVVGKAEWIDYCDAGADYWVP